MDTLELEPKLSLPPVLNYSTSSEASSVMVKGNVGRLSSLLKNLSIENETILSKCTNESIADLKEQLNTLRFGKTDSKSDAVNRIVSNDEEDLSSTNNNNFELSSELDGNNSFENSDLSILMKSRNSGASGKYIIKHLYNPNVKHLIDSNKTLNDTPSNVTSSSQEKNNKSINFILKKCNVSLKIGNDYSKKSIISSGKNSLYDTINQGDHIFTGNTQDIINGQNESQENIIISSSFENEKYPELFIHKKKTLSLIESNNNIKLFDKDNFSNSQEIKNCTFSDMESRKKNILKNKLKHCEVKLFDYLVEQETYNARHIKKNELIDKVFNTVIHDSTKEKYYGSSCNKENILTDDSDKGNINNCISEKSQVRNNLTKNNQKRLVSENEEVLYNQVINDNKEQLEQLINYIKKCNSPDYKVNKSNVYRYEDESLYESNEKLPNQEKNITKDSRDGNDGNKLTSNEESTKKKDKHHNIYSKFGKGNKMKDAKSIRGEISKIKMVTADDNDKIKDFKSSITNESDDSSDLGHDADDDFSDRISSRLRKRTKAKYTECKSLPKVITEEKIKKVVQKVALTSPSSKNNVKTKKVFKNNKSKSNRLKKIPQKVNHNIKTKTYVKIAEMRKFLRFKLPSISKTSKLIDCEDIIEKVNVAIRNAQFKKTNINITITTLQTLLNEKNICKNFIEFYTFLYTFTPNSFQKKVMPLGGAFGCNGPKVAKKLCDPLG